MMQELFEKNLTHLGTPTWFSRNEEIFVEGELATSIFKIKSGCMRTATVLSDGRRHILSFYLPGEFYGLEADRVYSVTGEAVTRCKMHIFKKSALVGVADEKIAKRLLMIAASELSRFQRRNLLLLRGAKERVVGFLLDMAERQTSTSHVDLPMTRGDVADYLGLTIETVSRMFGKLEDSFAIAIERRRVTLCDLPALKEMYGLPPVQKTPS